MEASNDVNTQNNDYPRIREVVDGSPVVEYVNEDGNVVGVSVAHLVAANDRMLEAVKAIFAADLDCEDDPETGETFVLVPERMLLAAHGVKP